VRAVGGVDRAAEPRAHGTVFGGEHDVAVADQDIQPGVAERDEPLHWRRPRTERGGAPDERLLELALARVEERGC
jgi:hypothetical protein